MESPIKLTQGQNKAVWAFFLKTSVPRIIEEERLKEAAEKEDQALNNNDSLESEQNEE